MICPLALFHCSSLTLLGIPFNVNSYSSHFDPSKHRIEIHPMLQIDSMSTNTPLT